MKGVKGDIKKRTIREQNKKTIQKKAKEKYNEKRKRKEIKTKRETYKYNILKGKPVEI